MFIPHVNWRRTELDCPNERARLFLDGHSSRRAPEALQALQDANIDVYTFPSHTSHIIQPLDCGVHRSFKAKLRRARGILQNTTVDQRRFQLIRLAKKASHEAMYDETIRDAWAASGIHPWNLTRMLAGPYITPTLPPELTQPKPIRKRSGISLNEKLLTGKEIISELKRKREVAAAPKKPRGRPRKKRAAPPSSDDFSE